MPSSHLILCRPLLLLPPIPGSIRVFSNESALRMRWPKYWSFSFIISPSNEHPGLISFRMDWLDLLAVQGTLKSLLQPHFKSINSLVLSFLHSPTLTSIHDHWKNHSLDYVDYRLWVIMKWMMCQGTSSAATNVPLWSNQGCWQWGRLHMCRDRVYANFLYFPFSFAMNLKLL